MKTLNIAAMLLLTASIAVGQDKDLAPDQNPRYRESRDQYMKVSDSLTINQGTTDQNTYKAYDFYEARMERRNERREFRRQAILSGAYNNMYYSPFYSYSPYGWGGSNLNFMWRANRHMGLGYGRWW